jgi:SAM-dependent methyltransferase
VELTNEEQTRYWNGDEAAHWLVHEERYERMLAPFTSRLLAAAGTGSVTRSAGRAAAAGHVTGVDLSAAMLRQAGRRTRQEGLVNVRFERGDAQVHRFTPGACDAAVSRFGVMFFANPAAAFANIAQGLRPGGRVVFVCWQGIADNEWITVPGAAAARHVALPPLDLAAPGPFSLGERDRIAAVLDAAALRDVVIEPIAEPLWMGLDVADAIAFITSTGIWNSLLRNADAPTAARVGEAVQAALEPFVTLDGLLLGSRAWLVTASRP